ncbi:MAG: PQQ-binding-like beta-propeller repeat protein [Acidobacteriota bacterium]|jgi:outer membrane protein assembly factor BamB
MWRDHALLLLLVVAQAILGSSRVPGTAPGPDGIPDDLEGLEPILAPGTVLLLGELHGTVEGPATVSRVVAAALARGLPVTVGLEIPREEDARVQAFLRSAGAQDDRAAMLAGPFWQSSYQDGRRSEAMANLIDDLRRRAGDDVGLILFDRSRPAAGSAEREEWMADSLASFATAHPDRLLVVLVGNLHARLTVGSLPGLSEPMATRIARRLPERVVRSLELAGADGTAWICSGRGGCGEVRVGATSDGEGPSVTLQEHPDARGYSGAIRVGPIHASPPAEPTLRISHPEPGNGFPFEHLEQVAQPAPRRPVRKIGNWPHWMGPRGDGTTDPGLLPRGAAVALELDWRRPIGRGYSSISVLGDRAVTLEAAEGEVRAIALDVEDGTTLWRTALLEGASPDDGQLGTPLSTPLLDGERVFVVHPAGRLFALNAADGALLWWKDLAGEYAAAPPAYGMSTSPVLHDGKLFLMVGGQKGVNLAAFDPATGKLLLSVDQGRYASYATPVPAGVDADAALIVPAGDRLYAVDPESGRVLWSYDGLSYPDRDPLVLPEERLFVPLQEHAVMLQVQRGGEAATVRELWRSERLQNSYSPAVLHEGSFYGFGGGSMMCLDASNGAVRWTQPLQGGSLIRVDDHLVALSSTQGILRVVPATPAGYTEAASIAVFAPGDYTAIAPSFGAGRIFLRGGRELAAVRLAESGGPAVTDPTREAAPR